MFPQMEVEPSIYQVFNTALFGIFGSLLGSFCNVVILRGAEGRSVIFPPSACPHCKHKLSPLDLIPIFGWVLLLGRCRYCSASISCQYPLVEFFAAFILAFSFWTCGASRQLIPTASFGIIWMVLAVVQFRGEVTHPGPFLWPLAVYAGLSLWAGASPLVGIGLAFLVGVSSGLAASPARKPEVLIPWMGSGLMATLGRPGFGWWGPGAILVAAMIVPRLIEGKPRTFLRVTVLGVHLFGIGLGIRQGFW